MIYTNELNFIVILSLSIYIYIYICIYRLIFGFYSRNTVEYLSMYAFLGPPGDQPPSDLGKTELYVHGITRAASRRFDKFFIAISSTLTQLVIPGKYSLVANETIF